MKSKLSRRGLVIFLIVAAMVVVSMLTPMRSDFINITLASTRVIGRPLSWFGPYTFQIYFMSIFYRLWLALPVDHQPYGSLLAWNSFFKPSVSGFSMVFCFKLPLIASTLLVGYLMQRLMALKGDKARADRAAMFWLLNPYVWGVAVMDGTTDIIAVLFVMLAVYLYVKGLFELSAAPLALGIACRFYPILFPPFFVIYLLKERRYLRAVTYSASLIGFSALLTLPYVVEQGASFYRRLFELVTSGWGEFLWFFGHSSGNYPERTISIVLVLYFITMIKVVDKWPKERIRVADSLALTLIFYVIFAHWNWYYPLWAIPFLVMRYHEAGRFRWSVIMFIAALMAVIGWIWWVSDFYFVIEYVRGNAILESFGSIMSSEVYQTFARSILAVSGVVVAIQIFLANDKTLRPSSFLEAMHQRYHKGEYSLTAHRQEQQA